MPVLNSAATLPEQLDALAAQTYRGEWELVIADNGSTDGSPELAGRWADRVPALRIVDASDRKGQNHARNAGASAARGDFIVFCDSDDVATPGWLEAMARAAGDCDLVGGGLDHETLNDPVVRNWPNRNLNTGASRDGFLPYAVSANLGVRASVFRALGGFNEEYLTGGGDDVDFCWRAQLASYQLSFAPDAVIRYRHRSDLRSLARQYYNYGYGSVRLYRDFRARGMPARRPLASLAGWARLASKSWMLFSPALRGRWVRTVAFDVGRIRGSMRFRVWYL